MAVIRPRPRIEKTSSTRQVSGENEWERIRGTGKAGKNAMFANSVTTMGKRVVTRRKNKICVGISLFLLNTPPIHTPHISFFR